MLPSIRRSQSAGPSSPHQGSGYLHAVACGIKSGQRPDHDDPGHIPHPRRAPRCGLNGRAVFALMVTSEGHRNGDSAWQKS
jgi:hypothetical protein